MAFKKSISSLRKLQSRALVGGVCAGLAYWVGVPMWMARVCVVALAVFFPPSILVYALMWMFMPAWSVEPADFEKQVGLIEPAN